MFRKLLLLVTALLATACSDGSRPMAPGVDTTSVHPSPGPIVPGPRVATIYDATDKLYDTYTFYHGHPLSSQYVFYEDSTFGLRFNSAVAGSFEYAGRFSRVSSTIKFSFAGWSVAGPWEATGTLSGDTLNVTYNSVMSFSDFIDGAYIRAH
jgi:hypothetical protein